MTIKGNIVDIRNKKVYAGQLTIEGQKITAIQAIDETVDNYILPGFVDAHVHIESSMLIPSEFAKIAVTHGTVATVSDPHEIANVLGVAGVRFMIDNGNQVPLKFNFGAPSCVPATNFETAGAVVDAQDIDELLSDPQVKYLAEMMNYPGVIFDDEMVHEKLAIAKKHGKPIDGHAPGLRGEKAAKYIATGISTDHECFTYEEAEEKLALGMKIIIREGSAAKNFEALIGLLPDHFEHMMFCSDDKHPDDLILGHINQLAARAIAKGIDKFKVLQAACLNPVNHYNLDVGTLQEGGFADFIVVEDLKSFKTKQTYINGELVATEGKSLIPTIASELPNNFKATAKKVADFHLAAKGEKLAVIEALDGELITKRIDTKPTVKNGQIISNTTTDVLKMTVVNRYSDEPPAIAFIKGFGLKQGALASCVGHDSHNIIAVGVDDESLCKAVNLIIEHKGGISAVGAQGEQVLPLPIAGIMTNMDGYAVAAQYSSIDAFAKTLGCTLGSPFMTLSFMALLVIPSLKLSDLGLFDGEKFEFTDLCRD